MTADDVIGGEPPSVGSMIRSAREGRGLSLRDLARLSDVSPGQISRIESGATESSSASTLGRLAETLGRDEKPLLFASKVIGFDQMRKWAEGVEGRVAPLQFSEDIWLPLQQDDEPQRVTIAAELWNISYPPYLAKLVSGRDADEVAWELDEIATSWAALTAERRRLVRAFVADQECLSRVERSRVAVPRYSLEISLRANHVPDEDGDDQV